MLKSIKIVIDKDGNIATDFNGFIGPSCFEEAEKLAAALAELGVKINVRETQPKSDQKVIGQQGQQVKEKG